VAGRVGTASDVGRGESVATRTGMYAEWISDGERSPTRWSGFEVDALPYLYRHRDSYAGPDVGEMVGQLRNPNVGNKRSPRANDHGRRTGFTSNKHSLTGSSAVISSNPAASESWLCGTPVACERFVRQNSAARRLLRIGVQLKPPQQLRTRPRSGISETGAGGRPVIMYAFKM